MRFLLLTGVWMWAFVAHAGKFELPKSLAHSVLTEITPFVFDPTDFDTGDFEIDWEGRKLEGVEFSLVPGSLVWVRVHEMFVIPRAQLRIRVNRKISGVANHHGSRTVFHEGIATLPVALMSGSENNIELRLDGEKGKEEAALVIRFKHRGKAKNRLVIDNSCSTHGLLTSEAELSQSTWAFVACRMVWMKSREGFGPSLELLVYWDNVGQEIEIDGFKTDLRPIPSGHCEQLRVPAS